MLVKVPGFITAYLRWLFKAPAGFKWFGDGLLDNSLGLSSQENAEATLSHSGWHRLDDRHLRRILEEA